MLTIVIQTIPHDQQRYDTVGDYFIDPKTNTLQIRVSSMKNWKYEALVAFHELVEYLKVTHDGVPLEDIDQFDMAYEAGRAPDDFSEPGDSPIAPYHQAHALATVLEERMAFHLDVDWAKYDAAVRAL